MTPTTYQLGQAQAYFRKYAGDARAVYSLTGELYASKSGWILLSVPNALVRGAFDALHEPGAELPLNSDGLLNAHVSVMRPEELEQIGGADKIQERGHRFAYNLGPLQECEPDGWDEYSKVWFFQVQSPELKALRKSYGLSPLPKYPFHATVARRRKRVLYDNEISKAAQGEGVSRDGKYARVQLLAGDDREVYEPESFSIPGLRGEGYYGLRSLAIQLPVFSGGYGSATAGDVYRTQRKLAWLLSGQLSVGHASRTREEQEEQPTTDLPRGNENTGGMGRTDRSGLFGDTHAHKSSEMVGGEGHYDTIGSEPCFPSLRQLCRSNANANGMGERAGYKSTGIGRSSEEVLPGRRYDTAGSTKAEVTKQSTFEEENAKAKERDKDSYLPHVRDGYAICSCGNRYHVIPPDYKCPECGGKIVCVRSARKRAALISIPELSPDHPNYPKKKQSADLIPGGLSDAKPPSAFPAAVVRQGQKVESEHTSSPAVAREIARDHLTEDPRYYDKLELVEEGGPVLDQLLRAKALSDRGNYAGKHRILSQLIRRAPADFLVDDPAAHHPGVTHSPTGFRFHAPAGLAALIRQPKRAADRPVRADAKDPADRENCPHCDTPMERGDDGYCNRCGRPWPAKTV